jgi:hypothetical protein
VILVAFGYAGNLDPSGPPAPTMKTLDEVEPRIPINADNTPGDTLYEYVISSSGSYYLTENVATTKGGIRVHANDVTIDLTGFALVGPGDPNTTGEGIYINTFSNVEIRNGTVRDFYYGIYGDYFLSQEQRVIDVRAVSNDLCGIYLAGRSHLVKDCTASENGASASEDVYGIYASTGSTVTGNTVFKNGNLANNVYGIQTGIGCTVTGNTVYANGGDATGDVYGIYLAGNCLVDQNTTYNNNTDSGGTNIYDNGEGGNCTFGTNHAP